MNKNIQWKVVFAFFMFSLMTFSCSPRTGGHKSTYIDGIGFQYDLPSDFCRNNWKSPNTLELYCAEGKMTITILNEEQSKTIQDVIIDLEVPLELYSLSTDTSISGTHGYSGDVYIATVTNLDTVDLEHNEYPYLLGVSTFGQGKYFVAQGFLYNPEYELRFSDIFFTVTLSFEPFSPP